MDIQTVDVDCAAREIGCSTWSIREMIRDGRLSAIRIGRGTRRARYKIIRSSLDALLRSHGEAGQSSAPFAPGGGGSVAVPGLPPRKEII